MKSPFAYGYDDKSLQEKPFYEDSARICLRLDSLQAPLNSRLAVEYLRAEIEKIVNKDKEN